MKYFLLILFVGYCASITLFTHTHIVNGVTIVHSHPYNPFSNNKPVNHQHSEQEFILIHLLSHFLAIVLFISVSIEIYNKVLRKHKIKENKEDYINIFFLSSNNLRAPPLNIHN